MYRNKLIFYGQYYEKALDFIANIKLIFTKTPSVGWKSITDIICIYADVCQACLNRRRRDFLRP